MNDGKHDSATPAVHIEFECFISPLHSAPRSNHSNSSNQEQLIVYAAPVIQMQLSSRCKETIDRLREIKKAKSLLLTVINPHSSKTPVKPPDDQQQ